MNRIGIHQYKVWLCAQMQSAWMPRSGGGKVIKHAYNLILIRKMQHFHLKQVLATKEKKIGETLNQLNQTQGRWPHVVLI